MKPLAFIAAAVLVAGCYPYYGGYEHAYVPEGELIVEAPPAPLVEQIPVLPYEGAIWVDGYWTWSGHRYSWVRGRYMRAPRAGVVWYHGGYVRARGGYIYVSGRWAAPGYVSRYSFFHTPRWHRHGWYRSYYRKHPRARRYHHGRRYHHQRRYHRRQHRRYRRGKRGSGHYHRPGRRYYRRHRGGGGGPPPAYHGGGRKKKKRYHAPSGPRPAPRKHRAPRSGGARRHRAPPAP